MSITKYLLLDVFRTYFCNVAMLLYIMQWELVFLHFLMLEILEDIYVGVVSVLCTNIMWSVIALAKYI